MSECLNVHHSVEPSASINPCVPLNMLVQWEKGATVRPVSSFYTVSQ